MHYPGKRTAQRDKNRCGKGEGCCAFSLGRTRFGLDSMTVEKFIYSKAGSDRAKNRGGPPKEQGMLQRRLS